MGVRISPLAPNKEGKKMRASELILSLEMAIKTCGDLEIVGGYLSDDSGLEKVTLLDAKDCDAEYTGRKAVAIFLQ